MHPTTTLGLAAALAGLLGQEESACIYLTVGSQCDPPSAENVIAQGKAIVRGRVVDGSEDFPAPPVRCRRNGDVSAYTPQEVTNMVAENILNGEVSTPILPEHFTCYDLPPVLRFRIEPLDAINLPETGEIFAEQRPASGACRDSVGFPLFPNHIVVLVREPGEDAIPLGGCERVREPDEGWGAFFETHGR